jgi:membrane protease YdiL (CAAX protease family)
MSGSKRESYSIHKISVVEKNTVNKTYQPEKYALLALGVFILSELVFVLLSIFLRGQAITWINLANAVTTIFVRWFPTLVIVYKIENRGAGSLGLFIAREKRISYAIFAIACLIVPAFFVGFDKVLLVEFVEQIIYIGLLEEYFYRGYLMNRFCEWLGIGEGLLLSAFLFGFGHVIARVADHGFGFLDQALLTGGQAFLGELIFGWIFLKVRNIWPGAILHISTNMYFPRILALFSS